MDAPILDTELGKIYKRFLFLWESYGFHVSYCTRDYGIYNRGFVIGLENEVCKMIFEKETTSPVEPVRIHVGKEHSPFAPPSYCYLVSDGWYSLVGLIHLLSGVKRGRFKNADHDLENVSRYVEPRMDMVIDLFRYPDQLDSKVQYYRSLHKDQEITLDKLRAERARLHALEVDSSLQAAMDSLSGGSQ